MQQVEGGANPEPTAAPDTSLPRHLASATVCAITWKVGRETVPTPGGCEGEYGEYSSRAHRHRTGSRVGTE